jgi:hypothetical protein
MKRISCSTLEWGRCSFSTAVREGVPAAPQYGMQGDAVHLCASVALQYEKLFSRKSFLQHLKIVRCYRVQHLSLKRYRCCHSLNMERCYSTQHLSLKRCSLLPQSKHGRLLQHAAPEFEKVSLMPQSKHGRVLQHAAPKSGKGVAAATI